MKIGLIGEKLGHSFSKLIHERLADNPYDLIPLARDAVDRFLKERNFDGLNVTIPYKQTVIPYCDEVDPTALEIRAVNTLVNQDGKLKGYNTDLGGFLYLVQSSGIPFAGKKVLILGSGGTSRTVMAAAKRLGARECYVVGRQRREGVISYEDCYALHRDAQVVVNTSPVGMYPNNGQCLFKLDQFPDCAGVVDVIYNPLYTELLLQAQERGIPCANGLQMLVAQAKYAQDLFQGRELPQEEIRRIYGELLRQQSNLVIIGMPSAGKTTIGRMAADALGKEFLDLDDLIIEKAGMSIPEIFSRFGEARFRELEKEAAAEASKRTGWVIATGGGCVKNAENMRHLRQNGVIVFLDRKLESLVTGSDRPLSSSVQALAQMYQERLPLYQQYSDIRVENNGTPQQAVRQIEEKYCEVLGA